VLHILPISYSFICGEAIQIMKLLIWQSSPMPYHLFVCLNILLSTLFSNTLNLCFSLSMRPSFTLIQNSM
jgi:hypothetical protein